MIALKKGVRVRGMSTQILLALAIAERIYAKHNVLDCVMTSCADGTHSRGSLHYQGTAIDLRTRNVPPAVLSQVYQELSRVLGDEYDVVLESDHLHIEWQPKDG